MNTWPAIHREAALLLCPDDIAEGVLALNAIIKTAASAIRKREVLFSFATALSYAALFLSIFVWCVVNSRNSPSVSTSNIALSVAALSILILAFLWWAWSAIQHGWLYRRFGRLPTDLISPALAEFIDKCARSERECRTVLGATVRASLFASGWAIMLFSQDMGQRRWVRTRGGALEKQEIFIRPVEISPPVYTPPLASDVGLVNRKVSGEEGFLRNHAPDIQWPDSSISDDAEPPLLNHNPADQWLVGGTAEEFGFGLECFLALVPSHLVEMYRLIMCLARRGMRSRREVDPQEPIITRIIENLEQQKLRKRGSSRTNIMNLLHGRYRRKDISGYFRKHEMQTPQQSVISPDS
jgi:hypothetical protein